MDSVTVVVLLLSGVLSGFLAGFFGVGGGIILVPILIALLQTLGVSSLVATHVSLGTSLFVIVFTSLSSVYEYSRHGHVVWKAVVFLGAASVIGAWAGSAVASGLQGKTLQQIFAAVVAFAAVRLLGEQKKPKGDHEPTTSPPGLIVTGLLTGVVSSLAGVGGGIFSIPIMYAILHFPLKKALGTSAATIVITALAAVVGYVVRGWGNPLLPQYTLGYVAYLYALPIAAASIPTARLGASLAHRTHSTVLRRIFAFFLLAISLKMFFL